MGGTAAVDPLIGSSAARQRTCSPPSRRSRRSRGHGRITATDLICLIRRCNRRCAHETLGTLVSRIVGCWCLRFEPMLGKWVGEIRWPAGSRRGSRFRATQRPTRPGHAWAWPKSGPDDLCTRPLVSLELWILLP